MGFAATLITNPLCAINTMLPKQDYVVITLINGRFRIRAQDYFHTVLVDIDCGVLDTQWLVTATAVFNIDTLLKCLYRCDLLQPHECTESTWSFNSGKLVWPCQTMFCNYAQHLLQLVSTSLTIQPILVCTQTLLRELPNLILSGTPVTVQATHEHITIQTTGELVRMTAKVSGLSSTNDDSNCTVNFNYCKPFNPILQTTCQLQVFIQSNQFVCFRPIGVTIGDLYIFFHSVHKL